MECDFGVRNHWTVTALHRALHSSTAILLLLVASLFLILNYKGHSKAPSVLAVICSCCNSLCKYMAPTRHAGKHQVNTSKRTPRVNKHITEASMFTPEILPVTPDKLGVGCLCASLSLHSPTQNF